MADLQWAAGSYAASHDVYFGTTLSLGAGEFKGNQTGTGFDPGTLNYETTYYWRIDEKNYTGTTTGEVWSFTVKAMTAPAQAVAPHPVNGVTNVNVNTHLHWTAGEDATSHDVYFGTSSSLGSGQFKGNQTATVFDPNTLADLTTYYWRIDEKNVLGTTAGQVWSFTTGRRWAPGPTGYIVGWGADGEGEVSNKPSGNDFVAVRAGHSHSLALRSDGTVAAWGKDSYGSGSVPPALAGKTVVDISTGYAHNLVLFDDGTVFNWGASDKPGPSWREMWPVPEELDGEVIVAIAAGGDHDVVLKDDGSLFSWGYDSQGQVSETPSGNDYVAVAAGNYHSLALKADGTVVAWGYDNYNQGKVPPEAHGAIAIEAGSYCSMALKADGTIVVWGLNGFVPSPNANFVGMGAGGYSKIALRSDGTIVSWRAGDSSPEPTTPTDAGHIAVAGGYYHWLAIKSLSTLPGQAINPTPASGQTNTNALGLNLKWMPGLNATSHKVYFGTNPTPGAGEYKGEQTGTTFNPGTLNYLTTYYWRIDEKNAVDTTTGVVWSFTTKPTPQIPGQASNPAPASGATNINITADLSWTAGSYAASHDVYFGTNPSPGTAEFKGNRVVNTFDPGVMSYGKTYYWRIDEKNEVGTTTGTVWNFATKAGPLNGLVSLWKLDDLYGSTAVDSSDNGHNGTLAGGVNWAPTSGILGGAASFDASADGRVSVPTTGMTASAGTIAMWVKLAEPQSELGKDGYRFLFGCTPDRIQIYMNDYDTQLDLGLGSDHLKHANIANLTTETWYHIALTWSGATYFVYVDGVARATGTYSGLNNIASQAAIGNNGVAQNQGFNGLIDDVGTWNRALAAGEISDLFNEPTVEIAGDPSPPDGSTYISTDADISWAAGKYAISHNVYFGTNQTPGTAEFKGNQTGKIFDPGALGEGTTYYWRIDEVNNTTTWTGDIWRFTTQAPVPPQQAGSPSPANGATAVDVYANLLWTAGAGSTSHDVYFGTNPIPGSAEFKGNITANTFEPGHLSEQTTYYWRIDEKNSYGTTTGAVWSFTTGTKPPPVLVSQWKFDETSGTTAADSSGNGHSGTLAGTVAWSPTGGTQNGAVNFDGSNNDGRVQIPTAGMNALQGTVTMWVKLAEPQYTLGRNGYKFIFGCGAHPNRIQLYMDNYDTSLDLGLGDSLLRKQDVVTLNTETWYHLALAWDGSSYVVYVNGVEKAAGSYAGLTALSTTAHIGNTGTETTQAFNGLIDNVTIWNDVLDAGEIINVYMAGAPLQDIATNPTPANGQQTVNTTVTLTWWPGRYTGLQDVYFGTNTTPGSGEYKGRQSASTFNPGTLNLDTTYYWRIDSVNDTNIWQGNVWNFTTYSGPPQQAANPWPTNSASGAPATAKLSWTAGSNTTSFNVYFGTNPTPGSAEFKGNQTEATFDPGSLNYQATYYWRIDAVGPGGTTTGAVWSFTTTVEAPAFPEAEGSGRWTIGGRGGRVIEVTNLNDSGPGSLRDAVAASGPRIVVFRVSGTIQLLARIRITNPYITIAGQTAPGDGICIRDYPLEIEASEVIVRHIRVRTGDEGAGAAEGPDTINVRAGVGIMLDHISASWSIDETLSIAEGSTRGPLDNVTVQWCIVSESLHCSLHVKGCHGYGSLIHGALGSQYSFHHNLYAHHQDRVPRPGVNTDRNHISDPAGWTLDWRNNVIYQGKGYNSDGDGLSKYNFIANYYTRTGETPYREQCPYSRAYFNDNWHNGVLPSDPWSIVSGCSGSCRQSSPFPVAPVETQDAPTAYTLVLADAGATLPDRDAVDERIVNQVITATGDLIDSQSQVGGWPLLQSTTPPIDTDHDGMPDSWESARGLNPNNAGDAALDRDADGYTNIEEYINGIPWP
jgi:alpha-tubulin suppressor-like RCC1 family protein